MGFREFETQLSQGPLNSVPQDSRTAREFRTVRWAAHIPPLVRFFPGHGADLQERYSSNSRVLRAVSPPPPTAVEFRLAVILVPDPGRRWFTLLPPGSSARAE